MASPLPSVTAIMPARDDEAHLPDAVASVLAQDYAGPLKLVIGVGPSADATERVAAELAATHPRITVVGNPRGGTAAGLNAALRSACGEVIVRVDSHCELPPGYVTRAVATLQRTGAANVGGVQAATGTTPYERAVARAMSSRFGVGDATFHYGGEEGPTDTVYLGVFSADALRQVGGFDESLVRNQDYELNWRLRTAGHVVWLDPNLVVRYQPRSSPRALAKQYFEYGRWKREVIRRHPRSTRARHLVAPLTVLGTVAGVAGALAGRRWMLAAPAAYAGAVALASVAVSGSAREALTLATVFPTMHLSWGAGFLAGAPRGAPPRGPEQPDW